MQLVGSLTFSQTTKVLGSQLLRSATSVGANYRAVCRAKSRADFISKLGIVEEEIDESSYWLELLVESKAIEEAKVLHLIREANELTAIIVSSLKTMRQNQNLKSPAK